jgi:hypothetical protein
MSRLITWRAARLVTQIVTRFAVRFITRPATGLVARLVASRFVAAQRRTLVPSGIVAPVVARSVAWTLARVVTRFGPRWQMRTHVRIPARLSERITVRFVEWTQPRIVLLLAARFLIPRRRRIGKLHHRPLARHRSVAAARRRFVGDHHADIAQALRAD